MKTVYKIISSLPLRIMAVVFGGLLLLGACSSDSDNSPVPSGPQNTTVNHHTLFMYFPWSGNANPLTEYFWKNIQDMKKAYLGSGIKNQKVIVFIQTNGTEGFMFNLADYRGYYKDSLALYRHYTGLDQTTADGIARILLDMKSMAPADSGYAMMIGCHGLGWVPVVKQNAKTMAVRASQPFLPHWDIKTEGGLTTRFFGGTSTQYQTNISTLAEAIASTGMKMEYILFDDCYMSSVEVAYDLRHVANYVIGCPTEVMGDGMPYDRIGRSLLGRPDYKGIVDGFVDYYSKSDYPYGTIGVTCCAKLDSLASMVKEMHSIDSVYQCQRSDIQRMDGYTPVLFYDFGDYIVHQCRDSILREQIKSLLARVVPYKNHTEKFPTVLSSSDAQPVGRGIYVIPIGTYSGITTSEPSVNNQANLYYKSTTWYKATH